MEEAVSARPGETRPVGRAPDHQKRTAELLPGCEGDVFAGTLAQADHPYYRRDDELLVTRDRQIAARLPCQRTLLPHRERWPTHHLHGHLGQTRDGVLHAFVGGGDAGQYWVSRDQGHTWQCAEPEWPGYATFVVLDDDSFLVATGGGKQPIQLLRSVDRGHRWEGLGRLPLGAFDAMHVDSNLLQLADGTILVAGMMCLEPPAGQPWNQGQYAQYVFRSTDRGRTWEGGGDPAYWQAVRQGTERIHDDGPEYTWPGVGGSFSGVYETGVCQRADGLLMGAFRFSGPVRPWHYQAIARWGEPPVSPDGHGRIFRHVVLGESVDGGRSWRNLRPIVDRRGEPLMLHGECNGELVELPDRRLVLVHQTRYAEGPDRDRGLYRGRSQLCARVSTDRGRTWQRQRYRVLFGFGYSSTLAVADGTLVTVTGACLGDNGDPRRAAVVRWRLRDPGGKRQAR